MTRKPTPIDDPSPPSGFVDDGSAGLFDELSTFATDVAVGVEAAALGAEDDPIADFVDDVEAVFGGAAAATVGGIAERLIGALGADLLADVEPTVLPPGFDLANARADTATVRLPDAPYIVDLGDPRGVGDGELARIVLRAFDRDGDDDDAEQVLAELLTGRSGANLDLEFAPGIDGVELVDISRRDYTVAFETAGGTDVLTLAGPGVEAVLARLAAGIDDGAAGLADGAGDAAGAPDLAALLEALGAGGAPVPGTGFDPAAAVAGPPDPASVVAAAVASLGDAAERAVGHGLEEAGEAAASAGAAVADALTAAGSDLFG
jgi:hypothetical protein